MAILDLFRGSKKARAARQLMAEFRARGEMRRLEFVERESLIVAFDDAGRQVATWNLAHLLHELNRSPESDHAEIIARYLPVMGALSHEVPRDYSSVRPQLALLLKDHRFPWFSGMLNRLEHPEAQQSGLTWRHIAPGLVACCIQRTEKSLRYVTQQDLMDWGQTSTQALDDAFANVRAMEFEVGNMDGSYFFNAQDSFISARLICEDRIRGLTLQGLPVAVVPDRDSLFFAGADDEAGLQLLANVIGNQFENASRHIIGGPFVLTADGWQAFEPPGSLRSVFAMLAGQYDCKAWADYRRHVQKQVEKSGESVLVAELSLCVMERESEYSTSVIWTRDVDTILPSADGVHFEDPADGSIRYAAWKMVRAVMGPAMEAYDGAPEVWRVKGFPTPEQFLAMGAQVQARAAG